MKRVESNARGRQGVSARSSSSERTQERGGTSIPKEAAVTQAAGQPKDSFEKSKPREHSDIGQPSGSPNKSGAKLDKVDELFEIAAKKEVVLTNPASGADPNRPCDATEVNQADFEYVGQGRWGLARRSERGCRWRDTKGNVNLLVKHLESHGTFAEVRRVYGHPESKTTLYKAKNSANSFVEAFVHSLLGAYIAISSAVDAPANLPPEVLTPWRERRPGREDMPRTHLQVGLDLLRVVAGLSDEIVASVAGSANHLQRSDSVVLSAIRSQGERAEVVHDLLRKVRKLLRLPSDINLNFIYKMERADASYSVAAFNRNGGLPVFLIYPGPNEGGVHGFAPSKAAGVLVRDLSELAKRTDQREVYEKIDENVELDSIEDALMQIPALGFDALISKPIAGHSFIQALLVSVNARYANSLLTVAEIDGKVEEIVRAMRSEGFNDPRDGAILDDARMTSRAVERVGEVFGLSHLRPYEICFLESLENKKISLGCSPISFESILGDPSSEAGHPVYIASEFNRSGFFEGMADRNRSNKAICRTNVTIEELDEKLAQFGTRVFHGVGDGKDYVRSLVSAANVTFNDAKLGLSQIGRLIDRVTQKLEERGIGNLDDLIDFPNPHDADVQQAVDWVTNEIGRFFGRKFDINVFSYEKQLGADTDHVLVRFPLCSEGKPGLNVVFDKSSAERPKRFSMLMTQERLPLAHITNVKKRLAQLATQEAMAEEEAAKTFEAASGPMEEKPEASASKAKRKSRRRRASRSDRKDKSAQSSQPGPAAQAGQSSAEAGGLETSPTSRSPVSSNYGAFGKHVFSEAELDAAARAETQRLLAFASSEEPALTEVFRDVANAHGGALIGLENRLKSEASLRRKIVSRASERIVLDESLSDFVGKASAKINDVLRYTVEFPADAYWRGLDASIESLAQRGITLRYQINGWAPSSPFVGTYRGLNATFQSPRGCLVELQVHTPMSLAVKNELHVYYEEARSPSSPPRRRAELVDIMRQRWKEVPEPST